MYVYMLNVHVCMPISVCVRVFGCYRYYNYSYC